MENQPNYERYQRQMILKNFGEAAQDKLNKAKVLVIGAGGLGCPALQYLAAAGIGTLGIVDDDIVSMTNLHRQILYTMDDLGSLKAETAALKLRRLNPDINIIPHLLRLDNQNALEILDQYDIIIDGTDNFVSRYLINDACVILKKILVYGAISQYEGQVAVFNASDSDNKRINYRDLFPKPPKDGEVLNCAEAGVIGVLPGIIGIMQANETIKLITGNGKPLINKLLTYSTLNNSIYTIHLRADTNSKDSVPVGRDAFKKMDYNWFCGVKAKQHHPEEIGIETFNQYIQNKSVTIIDVREAYEQPVITEFNHIKIPLSGFKDQMPNINGDIIVLFCHAGIRSLTAAEWLLDLDDSKPVYSLKGGIVKWLKHQQSTV